MTDPLLETLTHLRVVLVQGLVFSANYGSGSWSVISLDSGGVLGQVVQHEDFTGLCEVSHPHQTLVMGDTVWVVDLGCDTVWQYHHRDGLMERKAAIKTPAGCGPRHMTVDREGRRVFLLCEQDSLVLVYRSPQSMDG